MNQLDTYAVPDEDPRVDTLAGRIVARIDSLDGHALFTCEPDMIDGLLDTFRNLLDLPLGVDVFNVDTTDRDWDDLTVWEQRQWTALAATLRAVAMFHLDDDAIASAALDI